MDKVDHSIEKRFENYKYFKERLAPHVWFPKDLDESFTANFAIPVILDSREKKRSVVKELEENNIACRPIISGSMGTQPFYKKLYGENLLPNCSVADRRGIYVPNHPLMEKEDIDRICDIIIRNK